MGAENPKSPSRLYRAAPRRTGPVTKESGAKSIPVKDESAASSASGATMGAGGKARTSAIGTSNFRIFARLAAVQKLGGLLASKTQRSSLAPPTGLNTAWLAAKKP